MLPGPSASEVTTLWRYTNLFINIIIIIIIIRAHPLPGTVPARRADTASFHIGPEDVVVATVPVTRHHAVQLPQRYHHVDHVVSVQRHANDLLFAREQHELAQT